MYAFLACEHKLAPDAIGRLTPAQIAAFYIPERDRDGTIDLTAGAAGSPVDVGLQERLRRFRLGLDHAPARTARPPDPAAGAAPA